MRWIWLIAIGCLTTKVAAFEVGRGIGDITGPAAEVGMMGYASLPQRSQGIHTRLYARALVLKTKDTRVALVSVDAGQVFASVTREVAKRLGERYEGLYSEDQLILSATHTHSGPGGQAHRLLFNITVLGHVEDAFEAMVSGIVQAIVKAHEDLKPRTLTLAMDELRGISVNRSQEAFLNNDPSLRSRLPDSIDPRVVQLNVLEGDEPLGFFNWFGVHPVSINMANKLLSGDNKGYASQKVEKKRGEGFVAAFAQTAAGDISPNVTLDGHGLGEDHFESAAINGERQAELALALMDQGRPLAQKLRHAHRYVNLAEETVRVAGEEKKTCSAALGASFAAGTEDGRGPKWFQEGMRELNPLLTLITHLINLPVLDLNRCHAPKPVLLAVGKALPEPWVSSIVPVSLTQIGSFTIIALPTEITVAAGLKLRDLVTQHLGGEAVIAALSNDYVNYVTTLEEYQIQHYEGASTLFGPYTLKAYEKTLTQLIHQLKSPSPSLEKPPLKKPIARLIRLNPPVIRDTPPRGHRFGDVLQPPDKVYRPGDTVFTTFVTAHPRNDLRLGGTYLSIEDAKGQVVATDHDWSTKMHWLRRGHRLSSVSSAAITWRIPDSIPPGRYRVVHFGKSKRLLGEGGQNFQGATDFFTVTGAPLGPKKRVSFRLGETYLAYGEKGLYTVDDPLDLAAHFEWEPNRNHQMTLWSVKAKAYLSLHSDQLKTPSQKKTGFWFKRGALNQIQLFSLNGQHALVVHKGKAMVQGVPTPHEMDFSFEQIFW